MRTEVIKSIGKKVLGNLLILLIILALVITITGIPVDFDIVSVNGKAIPNMKMGAIMDSIKNNFIMFFSGKGFRTMVQSETVGHLLVTTAGRSSIILFFGAVLALIIGIPKGIIDSRKKDRGGTLKLLQSLIPLSVPDILTITLVQLLAMYLFNHGIKFLGIGPIPAFGDESIMYAIFPIISISILPAAYISRITATTIEESFTKPYILAARGKGCSRFQIIKNHMMKTILYGVLSGFPTVLGIMFSSLIIVERLYFYRGMGFNLIFLYTTDIIPPLEAGIAFTVFIACLAIFYYLVFMMFNALKNIVLPIRKAQ